MTGKNTIEMNGKFESTQVVDNINFLKVKLKVFGLGKNRNGSLFSLDSFIKARDSINLIPVVAKYTEANDIYGENGDLTGHNVELKEDGDGYKFHYDTFPIGVISNTSDIYIEDVQEDGEMKQYVIADEVYLWRRYEATQKIEEWLKKGIVPKVSMEIGNVSGSVDDEGYFQIDDFVFESVCALGSDTEPCFPRAEITSYTKKEFKNELKELVFELNKALNTDFKGGEEMTEKIERDYEKTEVLHENKEEEKETEVDIVEDKSEATNEVEDDKSKDNAEALEASSDKPESTFEDEGSGEESEVEDDPTNQDEGGGEASPEPELEESEVDTSELEGLVNSSDYDSGNYTEESYGTYNDALETANDTLGNAEATQEDVNNALQALQNAINGLESKPEPEAENSEDDDNTSSIANQPKRKKIEDFEAKCIEIFEQLSKAQSELDKLKEYKRQREESDLKFKFEGQLSEDEFKQVFSNLKESSIEDIEKELFALIGKKNFSLPKSNEQINKIPLEVNHNESNSENPYSALEIYIKK